MCLLGRRDLVNQRPELRVTVPKKGVPACWLILGTGKGSTASCMGMFKSIKSCLEMPLALYTAKSVPYGLQHSQKSLYFSLQGGWFGVSTTLSPKKKQKNHKHANPTTSTCHIL